MIRLNANIVRENCGNCTKQIYLGQSALVCAKCDIIFHKICLPDAIVFRENIYCSICVFKYDIIRYNPYYSNRDIDHDRFYETEISDFTDIFDGLSELLESCKQYSTDRLALILNNIEKLAQRESLGTFSSYFHNLDGNKSNFDQFLCELKSVKHEFSAIGITETNVNICNKDLYQINGYNSCYLDKKEGKKKRKWSRSLYT